MNSIDVIRTIISEQSLETANFTLIEHPVGVNWRAKNDSVGKKLRHLNEGLMQQKPYNEWKILGQELLSDDFRSEKLACPVGQVISISSRVIQGQKVKHLAIMNLHPEEGVSSDDVVSIVDSVTDGMLGYLLLSGRYFHFYGRALLSESAWIRFLAQFLMPTIIVSPRFIGHSLFRGYVALRLTTDAKHKPTLPEVCRILGSKR